MLFKNMFHLQVCMQQSSFSLSVLQLTFTQVAEKKAAHVQNIEKQQHGVPKLQVISKVAANPQSDGNSSNFKKNARYFKVA